MGVAQRAQRSRAARTQPTAVAGETDEVTTRRLKNREAQNAFRKRKQAAETAQQNRVRRLEEVVEEMSCLFMGVFDEMIHTEALVNEHPGLITSLRESLARVIHLAKEVVDIDGDIYPPTQSPPNPIEEAPSVPMHEPPALVEVVKVPPPQHQLDYEMEDIRPASPSYFLDSTSNAGSQTSDPSASFQLTSDSNPSSDSSNHSSPESIPPQVFGNGWDNTTLPTETAQYMTTLPPSYFQEPFTLPSIEIQNILESLGGFPLRLTETTLTHGYYSLVNAPPGYVPRGFQNTLRFKTREQQLLGFRWLLGPGRPYIYRSTGITWARRGGIEPAFPYHLLTPPSPPPNLLPSWDETGDEKGPPEYLSVMGITDLLMSLGARVIDDETMEVSINPATSVLGDGGPDQQAPSYSLSPDSFSYVDFFAVRQIQPEPMILKLNMTLLALNLARTSMCFAKGPGYPRVKLWRVLEASVTGASGGY